MKLKLVALLTLITALACGGSPELVLEDTENTDTPEASTACPEGVGVHDSWSGEYPDPILDVRESVTVKSRRTPCGPVDGECTIPPGLYHPWSQDNPAMGFTLIVPQEKYKALKPFTFTKESGEAVEFPAGTEVIQERYLAEGYCSLVVDGKTWQESCPFEPDFEKLPGIDHPEEQLLLVACLQGGQAYILDQDLLEQEGVKEGQILGYGEVGPAE